MRSSGILALVTMTACSRASGTATPAAPASATASATATAAAAATAAATATASASGPAFLRVAPLARGPVAVRGYPHVIGNGMNDFAMHAGFTKDSAFYGYCADLGGRDPSTSSCTWIDHDGETTHMSSELDDAFNAKKKRALDAFLKDNEVPKMQGRAMMEMKPPPVTGSWIYTDITIDVLRVSASEDKNRNIQAPAIVKVGGSVGGEPPVHPVVLAHNPVPGAPPHFAVLNSLAVSPDEKDIGMVGHFFACEYCDSFLAKRMTLGAFAALVYNDAGFRAHGKKDFVRSAELFAKAVAADPTAKLPPYNLACAWARLADARAKDALAYAIARDPSAKVRASTDKDFEGVRSQPWFADLVR